MYLTKEKKAEIFSTQGFQKKATDTGSPESQIALLTFRITSLTEHLREHKKDHSTRLGMLKIISQRKALLKYLQKNDIERYRGIIKDLGLRK